ncbi:Cytochrome b561 domain-containing protein [Aphelenchoides bicaudatus]|nr:Cytochrome b561 domain-containing protein [Aphelenchoides bicaudatus]
MRLLHVAVVLIGLHQLAQAVDLFNLDECDKDKLCEKRKGNDVDYDSLIGIKPLDNGQVEFELWSPKKFSDDSDVHYLAIGFSDDDKMGEDSVTYCYNLADGSNGIGSGKTVGKSFQPEPEHGDFVELEELKVNDGNFYCKFTQKVNQGSTDILKPDFTKPYHLLFVRGAAGSKSNLQIHKFGAVDGPLISKKTALVSETEPAVVTGAKPSDTSDSPSADTSDKPPMKKLPTFDESGENSSIVGASAQQTLKKLHGALMLLAWFGLVFSAVYSARNLREHWPNTTVQGLQIWFHIHRLLNFLGVVLIIVSVILIFVANSFQWSGPSATASSAANTSPSSLHSLLGTISVLLAILQPFMALARCDKNHPRRFIFNFFHRSAGLLALILAVITLGFAVFSFGHLWNNHTAAVAIFIAFLVFVVIIVVVQEVLRIRERKDHRVTAIEMHNRNAAATDSYYYKNQGIYSSKYRHLTSTLFIIFGSVSFAVAVVLAYFVLSS